MLALGKQHSCLPYVIALVAALSVKELFVESAGGGGEGVALSRDRWTKLRRSWAGKVSPSLLFLLSNNPLTPSLSFSVPFLLTNPLIGHSLPLLHPLHPSISPPSLPLY